MIVAVTAGKGGVGKSTVALNLAAELDGVVVDADLSMADLPTGRGPDLHDVLAGRADPTEAVTDCGSVAVLPCGRSLAGARATDVTELTDAVSTVSRQYGHVVVDCPAGIGSDTGVALLAADACVLVARPTETALADAMRARELARVLDTPLARVVLNRAPVIDTADIAATLGAPVTRIPESASLARAHHHGRPVSTVDPNCPAREQLASLAAAVQSSLRS